MSKVLVITTSLRAKSNSDVLAERVVAGAKDAGHAVEQISLKGKTYWRGHTPRYQEALLPVDGSSETITAGLPVRADILDVTEKQYLLCKECEIF